MENAIIPLMVAGFTSVLAALAFLFKKVVNQVDTNRVEIAKLDVRVAVVENNFERHEASHMASGYRLDRNIQPPS